MAYVSNALKMRDGMAMNVSVTVDSIKLRADVNHVMIIQYMMVKIVFVSMVSMTIEGDANPVILIVVNV